MGSRLGKWKNRDGLIIQESRLSLLSKENTCKSLKAELAILGGVVPRQYKQIGALTSQVTDLKFRSMENNLILTSIKEEKDDNCKLKVIEFLEVELGIQASLVKIESARRLGLRKEGYYRPVLAVVSAESKELIMGLAKNLKGRKNNKGKPFHISVQQPEAVIEAKRNAKALLKKYKEKNAKLPEGN